jgi:YD repeat-containing protein
VSRVLVRRRSQIGAQYDLESVRCLDGRGRAIQTRTRLAQGRWQVTGFTLYDRRSLPKAVSQPFVDVDGECDTAPPAGVRTQRYAYDATDRIVRTTEPDAEDYGTESVSQMEYLPLVTVSSDANDTDARSPHAGTPTTRRSDGLGRTVALERTLTPNGAPSVVTALYDGLGRRTGYLDPAGHRKTQTYDLAGRLLSIDDPNAGVTRFVYDDAGNLLERTDARGETVVTEYDGANRPVARFDAADPEGTRVVMRYDGCDDEVCSNPEGVLSEVTYPGPDADLPGVRSAPGRERYGYDVRGRSVYASRQIEGVTYSQTARYDNADRLRANDYPDGHSIERRYDDASRLIAIEGLIDDIEYDERGLVVAVTRADGTVDRTTHDSRLRLATLQTESAGRVLQGFEYTRDRVGNLTAIVDTSTEPGPAADAEIVHDAWYRSREVRLTIGGVDETLGWQFDALDNVVARTSSLAEGAHGLTGAFTYGDAGPNAVTAAGELTLEYDAAGQVSRRGDLAMTWDYQGRLTRMGDDVAHVYGADQTRVLTAARGSVTHYALPDFDVRDGIASLYVRIGRQRIARLDSAGLATGESRGDDVGFVDVYGFTGQEGPEDPRDPLIHFQFRWLDPALGRWGSPDPLFAAASTGGLARFGESTTAYAYVADVSVPAQCRAAAIRGKHSARPCETPIRSMNRPTVPRTALSSRTPPASRDMALPGRISRQRPEASSPTTLRVSDGAVRPIVSKTSGFRACRTSPAS